MRILPAFLFVLLLLLPAVVFAAGGHEPLSCTGCHGIHTAKGDIIFVVAPNNKELDASGKPYSGVTALCLGCHSVNGGMGILPVAGKHSHPYGIKPNPKVAKVPSNVLRNGKLGCVGCHDPHPSNPNKRYLRVGGDMANFCSLCHSSKSGKKIDSSKMFDSMDERKK
jgi:predicted CXXCH cytochrome family protein